ncbi:hypothetical protein BaRGS_00000117 [Batillaria attramentaria]|uniref:Uncharacterized protein n=1 Tax=Batillaria attramentaria TaxID=370345 RepID=A0ABD0MBI2_9CAEN
MLHDTRENRHKKSGGGGRRGKEEVSMKLLRVGQSKSNVKSIAVSRLYWCVSLQLLLENPPARPDARNWKGTLSMKSGNFSVTKQFCLDQARSRSPSSPDERS